MYVIENSQLDELFRSKKAAVAARGQMHPVRHEWEKIFTVGNSTSLIPQGNS